MRSDRSPMASWLTAPGWTWIAVVAVVLMVGPSHGNAQLRPSGGSNQAPEGTDESLKEIRKKLAEIQASAKLQIVASEARRAIEEARQSGSPAGYEFRTDDAVDEIGAGAVSKCLRPANHFLGTYAIAVVESEGGSSLGGGVGTTNVEFNVDKVASEFMRERVPLLGSKPGAWIAIDVDDGDVGYGFSERWPTQRTDTGTIRAYIENNQFHNSRFGHEKIDFDASVCGLVVTLERALSDATGDPSPIVLSKRRGEARDRADELTSRLQAALRALPDEGASSDDSGGLVSVFSGHLEQVKSRRSSVSSFPRIDRSIDLRTDKRLSKLETAVSELFEAMDAAERDLNTYREHNKRAVRLRKQLMELHERQWLVRVSWLPFTGEYRERRRRAEREVRKYLKVTEETVRSAKLEVAEGKAVSAVTSARKTANDHAEYLRILVLYAPAGLIGLLIVFGAYRVQSRRTRASRRRSNLQFEISDRREALQNARQRLESAAREFERADDQTDRLEPTAFTDLGRESVQPPEAVDIGLSIASLEEHLLQEAELQLDEAGRWGDDVLQEALEKLQTGTTTIHPGSEWERTRIEHSLTGPLEVAHRRTPEHLEQLARVAMEGAESLSGESSEDPVDSGDDTDDPGADVHW